MQRVKREPVTKGYFDWPSDDPKLLASRCLNCGTTYFPRTEVCGNPGCKNKEKDRMEDVHLSKKGELWSYSWQYYEPPLPFKGPNPFVPYGIALVRLPEGLKVAGMLTGCKFEDLKLGMEMEMVVERMYQGSDGTSYVTWKFKPVKVN